MRTKAHIICSLLLALPAWSHVQAQEFSLGLGALQQQEEPGGVTIHYPLLAHSSEKLKSLRFVVQFDTAAIRFKRMDGSAAEPAASWKRFSFERLPDGQVSFLLRRTAAGSEEFNDSEIARLVFERKLLGNDAVAIDTTGTPPGFVILNPGPQEVVPKIIKSREISLQLSEWRLDHGRMIGAVLIEAQLAVRKIKFIVEYDDRALASPGEQSTGILAGSGLRATDFVLKINTAPAVPPSGWANRNVEIEIESPTAQKLSGRNIEIVQLIFVPRDTMQQPRIEVNHDCSAGFFVVEDGRGQLQQRCLDGQASGNPTEATSAGGTNLPTAFALLQNYPNPIMASGNFNAATSIRFDVPRPEKITIQVYNILGQLVKSIYDQTAMPGFHRVLWQGDNASGHPVRAGIYFVRMRAGNFVQTRRLLVLR